MTEPRTDVDREKDRATHWRIGKAAAVAALVAAAISAGAILGGAALGSHLQARSNQSEAKREFQRSEELTVYSDFVKSANEVYDAAYYFIHSVDLMVVAHRNSKSIAAMERYSQTLALKQEAMQHVIDQIQLIGTDAAYESAIEYRSDIASNLQAQQTAQTFAQFNAIQSRMSKQRQTDIPAFIAIAAKDVKS